MSEASEAVILVGRKPTMNYVLATTMPLTEGKKVVLKARGRAISKAVDVAQIVTRRFIKEAEIQDVNIGTEEGRVGQDGRPRSVSTIEIMIAPKKPSTKK
ncbi:MAG: DNA-binding protein Alba [Thaumarchaeota archaeon]|nr:DNA-binding protein Alba [Nitrososphaerota archaeon]